MQNSLGDLAAKLTLDNKQYMTALGTANTGTTNFTTKVGSATASLAKFAVTAATAAAGALTAIGTVVVKNTSELEQNKVSFEAMLGSAEKATQLLGDLAKFAKETPFELGDLQTYSKQLLAYGFGLEELIPTLTTVGNISAGLGKESLPILIRALGQIQAKGKLAGQEFLQLTETGLPVADALAKRLGITVQQLTGNIADLNIPYEQVLATIQDIEKNQFKDLMVKQSKTLNGIWSNIKDTFTQTTWQIGEQSGLFDLVKGQAQSILDKFSELTPVLVDVSKKFVSGIVEETKNFAESKTFTSIKNIFIEIKEFIERVATSIKNLDKEGKFDGIDDSISEILNSLRIMFNLLTGSDQEGAQTSLGKLLDIFDKILYVVNLIVAGITGMTVALTTFVALFDKNANKLAQTPQVLTYGPTKPTPQLKTEAQKVVDAIKAPSTTTASGYTSLAAKYGLSAKAGGGLASDATVVGENGPEILTGQRGARIYNNLESQKLLNSSNRSGMVVNNTFNVGQGVSLAVLTRELNWMYRRL